jgi:hypothetical protein
MTTGIQLMQQGPPPYIRFEQRAEEDRDATIKADRLVLKDVDYVIIHRAGSKDSVEKIAAEWLDDCEKKAHMSPPKWPLEWANAHRQMYNQWKAGQEVTQMGFPIRQWAAITKAQAENLVMARILTVEDLAAANDQALNAIGMGGRALKERAMAWLESNKGNKGEELAALRAQNADLQTQVHNQNAKIQELEAAILGIQAAQPRKRA